MLSTVTVLTKMHRSFQNVKWEVLGSRLQMTCLTLSSLMLLPEVSALCLWCTETLKCSPDSLQTDKMVFTQAWTTSPKERKILLHSIYSICCLSCDLDVNYANVYATMKSACTGLTTHYAFLLCLPLSKYTVRMRNVLMPA